MYAHIYLSIDRSIYVYYIYTCPHIHVIYTQTSIYIYRHVYTHTHKHARVLSCLAHIPYAPEVEPRRRVGPVHKVLVHAHNLDHVVPVQSEDTRGG